MLNPLSKLSGRWQKAVGIDLGTANTLMVGQTGELLLNEPSVVAVRTDAGTQSIVAVGEKAKQMLGKTPGTIRAVRPLRDGVIADFELAEAMIKFFIRKSQKRSYQRSPLIVICVPSGSTAVERRAIRESAEGAGGREVYLIEEPMAAALGANLPVTESTGCMIVDIGGGTTEVAVISLGGIVCSLSARVAGDKMDEAIVNYIRRMHNMLIGETTAERLKQNIGSACINKDSHNVTMMIKGRSLTTGAPNEVEITQAQVAEALFDVVSAIVDAVKTTLENTPPELAADIYDRGIMMTGGGSLLSGLAGVIHQSTGVPVSVSENALHCVVLGTGRVLEDFKHLRGVLTQG